MSHYCGAVTLYGRFDIRANEGRGGIPFDRGRIVSHENDEQNGKGFSHGRLPAKIKVCLRVLALLADHVRN
jgi:hypothetical protein